VNGSARVDSGFGKIADREGGMPVIVFAENNLRYQHSRTDPSLYRDTLSAKSTV
jgi:hypothetical protein